METLISTRPDSALLLLRSFHNNSDEISEIAKYALLLTQAEDKNYILHTEDSLIKIAVNYYDSINDREQSVKAHYYLGRVYQDMQIEEDAVREFLIALQLAEKNVNSQMLCLLYGNLGQIYFQQNLLVKADSLFALSESIAKQNGDSLNLSMAFVARGNVCLWRKKHDSVMNYYERALAIAIKMQNINTQKIVFNSMAAFYTSLELPRKTIEYSKSGLSIKSDSLSSARLYLLEGNALAQLAEYDSAKLYINKCLYAGQLSTRAAAYLLLAEIEEKQGHLKTALSFQRQYIECLDSLDLMESKTKSAILKGSKSIYLGKYQKLINKYQLYLKGLLMLVFVLMIYWISRKYKYSNKIHTLRCKNDYLEVQLKTLSVLQGRLREKEKELALLQDFVGTVEEDKLRLYYLTNQVNILKKENKDFFLRLLSQAPSYKMLIRIIHKKKDNCRCKDSFSEKDWDVLLQDINYLSNGFVDNLKVKIPLLSKSDIRFCCLFKIGINYVDMALVFDRTLDAMYKKRNAILGNKIGTRPNYCSFDELIESI